MIGEGFKHGISYPGLVPMAGKHKSQVYILTSGLTLQKQRADAQGPLRNDHSPPISLLVPGHPFRSSILGLTVEITANSSDVTAQRYRTLPGLFVQMNLKFFKLSFHTKETKPEGKRKKQRF